MKTREEIRDWLLENAVNGYGDLILRGLNFSDFEGNVYINNMKVKGSLSQSGHEVKGDLYQSLHEVQGNLYQNRHEVRGDLYQSTIDVQGDYFSKNIKVGGDIYFDEPTKMLKKITTDELKEMGYELVK